MDNLVKVPVIVSFELLIELGVLVFNTSMNAGQPVEAAG